MPDIFKCFTCGCSITVMDSGDILQDLRNLESFNESFLCCHNPHICSELILGHWKDEDIRHCLAMIRHGIVTKDKACSLNWLNELEKKMEWI